MPRRLNILGKAALLVGVMALSTAILLASGSPGAGVYEVSIYTAYPWVFWASVFAAIICGLFASFTEIRSLSEPYRWIPGLLLVVATNVLVLSLPYLRDYAFYGQWDPPHHFSYALSVLEKGVPHDGNFYPISHVLVTGLSLLTGLDLQPLILLFAPFLYLLYLANVAFAIWTMSSRPPVRGAAMLLASPIIYYQYGTMFYPTQFAVYMLPLLVAMLVRSRQRGLGIRQSVAFILLLFFLPFLHPWAVVSALVVILSFIVAIAGKHLLMRLSWSDLVPMNLYSVPLLILVVTFLGWFMTFAFFGKAIGRIVTSFVDSITGARSLSQFISVIQSAQVPTERILGLVLFTYGPTILYVLLATLLSLRFLRYRLRENRRIPSLVVALFLSVGVFSSLAMISLFRDLITASPLRISNFALALVPLLVGLVVFNNNSPDGDVYPRVASRIVMIVAMLLVIGSASVVGILGAYYSPLTGNPNHQYSYSQQAGVRFLVDRTKLEETGRVYSPFKGSFIISGVIEVSALEELRSKSARWWIELSPAHFGYLPDEMGLEFEEPNYLFITAYERAYYSEVWPKGGRYNPEDFERLEADPRWNKVYVSGDFSLWRSRGGSQH